MAEMRGGTGGEHPAVPPRLFVISERIEKKPMNSVKTVLLLGLLSGVLLFGGEALGGRAGLEYALAIAVAMNFASYFFSDKIASVAFTEGILRIMNDREIEGVVAHELGHVLHRDILISSVAATLAAAITFLARMAGWAAMFGGYGGDRDREDRGGGLGALLMIILAPIAAMLIQMAISRSREYAADEASAKYTGSPDELISALRKLEAGVQRIPMEDATPATAHLWILNPFSGDGLMRLFSTHPSTADRIARLEAMRGDAFRNLRR